MFWRRERFTALERRVLDAAAVALSPAARPVFQEQVAAVNLVQRHGREILCYTMRRWRVDRRALPQFANRAPELAFAQVTCALANSTSVSAKLWASDGRFVSIVFSADPKKFAKLEIARTEARILQDPDIAGTVGDTTSVNFPADYLDFVGRENEVQGAGYTVFGRSRQYEVVLDDADYHVIAEISGEGTIALRTDGTPELYFIEYDNVPPVPVGTSLMAALERFAKNR
jgi:hypothetical protein